MTTIAPEVAEAPAAVPFREGFFYWLKLGFISFGGPAGQISMMHQELVEKRRWISEHRFLHALNYTMVLPGPEAQQLATYIGWLMHGVWGGIAAGVLFVLPSLFILVALTWIYLAYGDLPVVEGILYGIKPAVTAIVVFAAYRIGSRALKNNVLRAMAAAAFLAIFAFSIPFPYIVVAAGITGYIGSHFMPGKFVAGGHQGRRQSHSVRHSLTTIHLSRSMPVTTGSAWLLCCWPGYCLVPVCCCCSSAAMAGKARLPRWAGSSPRLRWLRLAVPMRCCPMSIRAVSSSMPG